MGVSAAASAATTAAARHLKQVRFPACVPPTAPEQQQQQQQRSSSSNVHPPVLHQQHQSIEALRILKHNGLLWDAEGALIAKEHNDVARARLATVRQDTTATAAHTCVSVYRTLLCQATWCACSGCLPQSDAGNAMLPVCLQVPDALWHATGSMRMAAQLRNTHTIRIMPGGDLQITQTHTWLQALLCLHFMMCCMQGTHLILLVAWEAFVAHPEHLLEEPAV